MATLKKITLRDVKAEQRSLKLVEAGKLLNPLFVEIKSSLADMQKQAAQQEGAAGKLEKGTWHQFCDVMQEAATNEISPEDFQTLMLSNFDKQFADTLTKTRRAYISTAANAYESFLSTYAPMYAADVEHRQEAYSNKADGSRKVAGAELTAQRFITAEAFTLDTGEKDKEGNAIVECISYEAARKVISGVNGEVMKEKGAPVLRFTSLLKQYTNAIADSVKDRKENAEKGITKLEGLDVGEMTKWLEAAIKEVPQRKTALEGKSTPVGDAITAQPTGTEGKQEPKGLRKVG